MRNNKEATEIYVVMLQRRYKVSTYRFSGNCTLKGVPIVVIDDKNVSPVTDLPDGLVLCWVYDKNRAEMLATKLNYVSKNEESFLRYIEEET